MSALRILLVDDDLRLRRTLARALRSLGTVDHCGSANEALSHLGDMPYDVVISDHSMPGRSGRELLGIVARAWPKTARILISAEKLDPSIDPTWQVYLLKPFGGSELLAAVHACVSG